MTHDAPALERETAQLTGLDDFGAGSAEAYHAVT